MDIFLRFFQNFQNGYFYGWLLLNLGMTIVEYISGTNMKTHRTLKYKIQKKNGMLFRIPSLNLLRLTHLRKS